MPVTRQDLCLDSVPLELVDTIRRALPGAAGLTLLGLYFALSSYQDGKSGERGRLIFKTHEAVARSLGIAKRTWYTYLRSLVQLDLLTVVAITEGGVTYQRMHLKQAQCVRMRRPSDTLQESMPAPDQNMPTPVQNLVAVTNAPEEKQNNVAEEDAHLRANVIGTGGEIAERPKGTADAQNWERTGLNPAVVAAAQAAGLPCPGPDTVELLRSMSSDLAMYGLKWAADLPNPTWPGFRRQANRWAGNRIESAATARQDHDLRSTAIREGQVIDEAEWQHNRLQRIQGGASLVELQQFERQEATWCYALDLTLQRRLALLETLVTEPGCQTESVTVPAVRVAEHTLRRPLAESELSMVREWVECYGFGANDVHAIIREALHQGQVEKMDRIAFQWYRFGGRPPKTDSASAQHRPGASDDELAAQFGLRRSLTTAEQGLVAEWSAEWSRDVIDRACAEATGCKNPLQYVRQVLESWRKCGVRTIGDAESALDKHQARRRSVADSERRGPRNSNVFLRRERMPSYDHVFMKFAE